MPGAVHRRDFLTLAAGLPFLARADSAGIIEIPSEIIEDKIRGGFLGQIVGDLNGLKHEMKYIQEPGNVQEYTPALPDGGWTDDDTDIEWPYILEIQKAGKLELPYPLITEVWKKHINRRIWCSHLYLRQLLDLGIDPPVTGRLEINPWADFNLSGQFVSESWGLISPGMPQTAARIGIHYTHVGVDGEPIQSTQMMDAMISAAFLTSDMDRILDAGAAALDPRSVMHEIMSDVRRWHRENPAEWRATRRLTKDKYCKFGGEDMRDRNGVWLNGASTIAALLYGGGDWVQTVRAAFNFGWDADNNAAASGTIAGVIKGNKWLQTQHWNIEDRYRNTSRDNVPGDETLTSYEDRLLALADINILGHGGTKTTSDGRSVYRIVAEKPANVEPLPDPKIQRARLGAQSKEQIEGDIIAASSQRERARGAYLGICLDFAPELKAQHTAEWTRAVQALAAYPRVMQVMFFESPIPAGEEIRRKALAAGLRAPSASIPGFSE